MRESPFLQPGIGGGNHLAIDLEVRLCPGALLQLEDRALHQGREGIHLVGGVALAHHRAARTERVAKRAEIPLRYGGARRPRIRLRWCGSRSRRHVSEKLSRRLPFL